MLEMLKTSSMEYSMENQANDYRYKRKYRIRDLTVDEIISQVKFILENMYITFDLSTIINIVNSGRLQVMSYCNKIDL